MTALESLRQLRDYLAESHAHEVEAGHYGDGDTGCTYCAAIKAAEGVLAQEAEQAPRDLAQAVLDLGGYVSEMCDVLEWGDANDLAEPTSDYARASRLSNAYGDVESKAQAIMAHWPERNKEEVGR